MMRDDRSDVSDTPAAKLGQLAGERLGSMSDVQQARGLMGVLATFAETSPRRRAWFARPVVLAGMAVVLVVLAGAATLGARSWRKQPLTFVMSDGEVQAGGYFRIASNARPTLEFSDGSKVALGAGARGRLASVDAQGARVMLDDGDAHVLVVPHAGAQWLFDAGPFLVRVHGTEFDLAWNADEGRLDVRLHAGAVSVDGPVSNQAISLQAGQWLTVRLASHEVFVRNLDADAAPPAVAPPAPAAVEPAAQPAAPVKASPTPHLKRAPAHQLDWSSARADGDWGRIVEAASRHGLDRSIAERDSEDLALLADAAHYVHRDDIAERALLAQRKRFAGSTRAKDAAFLLGRIIEARPGGANEALSWYDRHMEEAPNGVYASEALGRKMTLLGRLRGEQAARPIAEEYLRLYPAGTYARAARAYTRKP